MRELNNELHREESHNVIEHLFRISGIQSLIIVTNFDGIYNLNVRSDASVLLIRHFWMRRQVKYLRLKLKFDKNFREALKLIANIRLYYVLMMFSFK
jgi:hypothetical protein